MQILIIEVYWWFNLHYIVPNLKIVNYVID